MFRLFCQFFVAAPQGFCRGKILDKNKYAWLFPFFYYFCPPFLKICD